MAYSIEVAAQVRAYLTGIRGIQVTTVAQRSGYRPMIMKGKELPGYCYVAPEGFADPDDFSDWLELCLAFNEQAKKA